MLLFVIKKKKLIKKVSYLIKILYSYSKHYYTIFKKKNKSTSIQKLPEPLF